MCRGQHGITRDAITQSITRKHARPTSENRHEEEREHICADRQERFLRKLSRQSKRPPDWSTTIQVNRARGLPDRCTARAISNRMRDDALLGFFDVLPRLRESPDVRAARRSPSCHLEGEDRPRSREGFSHPRDGPRPRLRGGIKIAAWPAGTNSSSRCRYSPNPARLRQSLPSRCHSARPTAPRHALHSRSDDAQSGIKPCAPHSSTIAFECALISLIWSSSVRSLRTRHQYPTTALVI